MQQQILIPLLVLFNRDTVPRDLTFNLRRHLPFYEAPSTGSRLRDLWAHADVTWDTAAKDSYTARAVPSHGVVVLRVFGVGPWATSSAPSFAEETEVDHAEF